MAFQCESKQACGQRESFAGTESASNQCEVTVFKFEGGEVGVDYVDAVGGGGLAFAGALSPGRVALDKLGELREDLIECDA